MDIVTAGRVTLLQGEFTIYEIISLLAQRTSRRETALGLVRQYEVGDTFGQRRYCIVCA